VQGIREDHGSFDREGSRARTWRKVG
jgi:hypothetical protein